MENVAAVEAILLLFMSPLHKDADFILALGEPAAKRAVGREGGLHWCWGLGPLLVFSPKQQTAVLCPQLCAGVLCDAGIWFWLWKISAFRPEENH